MSSVVLGSLSRLLARMTIPKVTSPPKIPSMAFGRLKVAAAKFNAWPPLQAPSTSAGKKSKRGVVGANTQHEEWVKFQQSIAVDGFQTGQTTTTESSLTGRKDRGGRKMRKRKERELELKERENLGGGQFPSLRFSDEETERLLAQAYAAIPPRAGKRGTRNLKRQRARWFAVRKIHARQKFFKKRAHERRMAKRSFNVGEVMRIKREAESVRTAEKEYQERVLKRWVENVVEDQNVVVNTAVKDGGQ